MITCNIPATALIMYLSSNLMWALVKERELGTLEEIDDVTNFVQCILQDFCFIGSFLNSVTTLNRLEVLSFS